MAFVNGFVRQHWLTNDVTNGEDVVGAGAQLVVSFDKAFVVNFNAGFVGTDFLAVWSTPNSYQNRVVFNWLVWCVFAFKSDVNAVFLGFHFSHFGFKHDVLILVFHFFGENFDQVFVSRRDQLIHKLNHVQLRAERAVDTAHFQTNNTAAKNQHFLWYKWQFQSAG